MGENRFKRFFINVIRVILPVCLIAAGVAGWKYYLSQGLEIKRRPPNKAVLTVETIQLKKKNYPASIEAMGTVLPARKISLKARLSGEVVSLSDSFVRAGIVKKGEVLCVIDDVDFQIEVEKAQSALDKALSDLSIELGSQKIALEEYKLISQVSGKSVEATDLALRKPQLTQAKAAVKSARASLEKAEINLTRTRIKAPFNSLVVEKNVDLGSLISSQETLAVLVDVDRYHVETLVSPDQLEGLHLASGKRGRAVVSSQYSDRTWDGFIERITGEISQTSRMAEVLIAVDDPLGMKNGKTGASQLMLNDYVAVNIFGRQLDDVFALPRELLRDKNTIWINRDGRLLIQSVSIAWKEKERVFVDNGLSEQDKIVVTDLPAPVQGMALLTAGSAKKRKGDRPIDKMKPMGKEK